MPEWILKVAALLAAIASCFVFWVLVMLFELLSVIEGEEDPKQ